MLHIALLVSCGIVREGVHVHVCSERDAVNVGDISLLHTNLLACPNDNALWSSLSAQSLRLVEVKSGGSNVNKDGIQTRSKASGAALSDWLSDHQD